MRDWVTRRGVGPAYLDAGRPPVFLGRFARLVLTAASIGGLLGLIVSLARPRREAPGVGDRRPLPWRQLCILLGPFAVAYALILASPGSSAGGIPDRYLLELLAVALPPVVRLYQEQIRVRTPGVALLPVAVAATYGVVMVHNMFSLDRARVRLAAELHAQGVPDTAVDNGWEQNFVTEIRFSGHINDPRIQTPPRAYVPVPALGNGPCPGFWFSRTPHVHPSYAISFDANACYGPAPFTPVHYSRWLASSPGTLYVVRYVPPTRR